MAKKKKLEETDEFEISSISDEEVEAQADETKAPSKVRQAIAGKKPKKPSLQQSIAKPSEEPGKKVSDEIRAQSKPAVGTPEHKEMVADRAKFQQLNKAAEGEPEDIMDAYADLAKLTAEAKASLPGFEDKKAQIKEGIAQAEAEFKKDKDQTKRLQAFEALGHALTQLGAGIYGAKHGVNMSGIKFNKADWDKSIDQSFKELAAKRAAGTAQVAGVEKEKASVLDRIAKLKEAARREKKEERQLALQERQLDERRIARQAAAEERQLAKREKQEEKRMGIAASSKKAAQTWETEGRANAESDLQVIAEAREAIESGEAATGGLYGLTPQKARLAVDAIMGGTSLGSGVAAELKLASIAKKSLKEILGGAFSEREGRELVESMVNPALSKELYLDQIKVMENRIQAAAAAKEALVKEIRSGRQMTEDERTAFMKHEYAKRKGSSISPSKEDKSSQNQTAIEWARKNPNDPRAAAVLKKAKGGK